MTDQEYADYLADPLNRAFVQEHERRQREEDQKAWVEKLESFSIFHTDEPPDLRALRSIDDKTSHLSRIATATESANRQLMALSHDAQTTMLAAIETEGHTEAANIWHAIQTLVLIAGLLGIVATLRGWW